MEADGSLIEQVAGGIAPVLAGIASQGQEQQRTAVRGIGLLCRVARGVTRWATPLVAEETPPEAAEEVAGALILMVLGRAVAVAGLEAGFAGELLDAARRALPGIEGAGPEPGPEPEPEADRGSTDAEPSSDAAYLAALAGWIEANAPALVGVDFGPGGAAEAAEMALGLMRGGAAVEAAVSQAVRALAPGVARRLAIQRERGEV